MIDVDFPTWFGMGSFGGLLCALAAAAGIAAFALLTHRGASLQLARAILACLAAGCLILPSIWWDLNRLDLFGPALPSGEVAFWLCWTIAFGWGAPLGVLAYYMAMAAPQPAAASTAPSRPGDAFAALDGPGRRSEPLGAGQPWGHLVPLDGAFAGHPIALTRELTILGRELDSDLILDDERTSRHHAEIHWEHGRPHLKDRASLNGTLVNRQTVRGPMPLKTGDIIELGAQRYRFELLASGTPSRPRLAGGADETHKMPGVDNGHAEPQVPTLALVVLGGALAGTRWELHDAVASIGRDPECAICLRDDSVSRQHAQIVRQRAGYYISDVGSSNGTLLNGVPLIAPTLLAQGDVLRLGTIELRCEAAAEPTDALADNSGWMAPPTQAMLGSQLRPNKESAQRPTPPTPVRFGPVRLAPAQPPSEDEP
jgi:pSer/pThr/pTyr-binding forkhead associated (FHA) protein